MKGGWLGGRDRQTKRDKEERRKEKGMKRRPERSTKAEARRLQYLLSREKKGERERERERERMSRNCKGKNYSSLTTLLRRRR
jgi:hypothetical protein